MQAILFEQAGKPASVLSLQEVALTAPQSGEVRIKVQLASINPADLMYVQNMYGIRPTFPSARAGFEGMGIIDACGEGVNLPLGMRVAFTAVGAWAEYAITSAKAVIPVPDGMSDEMAAQLFVNPYTAYAMMLESGVQAGDYLMLSAAGSAFGKALIQFCHLKGIKTIGTVRRPDMIDQLQALGATAIINTTSEDPLKRVKEITEGKGVACILDAVAGPDAVRLLPCLRNGGKMIVYGALSLESMPINVGVLIFKEIAIQGFWLSTWMRRADPAHKKEVMENVGRLLADGTVQLPVEATYSLVDIHQAVRHADTPGRVGKILLKP